MEILQIIMQVILGVTSVLLTLFILLHKGRGGGLSDMFGGGVGSSMG
ncbi:preprotein translocase subunit SecG, partial [Marinomonas agarivorans]